MFSVRGKLRQKRQLMHKNLRDQNPSRSPVRAQMIPAVTVSLP